jgi:fimbrial chaperone protein
LPRFRRGASQTFRVTLHTPFSGDTERAFRLILEDVSEAAPAAQGTVELRLNQSLPVYVALSGEERLAPAWSQCAADAGKGCVRLDNSGNRHLQVIELTAEGENCEQKIQGVGAILPGAWKQWLFDLPKGKGLPKKVSAKTLTGSLSADLAPPKH